MQTNCFRGPLVDLIENPDYTIFDSLIDSVRFIQNQCITEYNNHACVISNFVNEKGEPQLWHDFGPLEGPGWAANTIGGAYELHELGRFTHDENLITLSLSLLDHILEDGFIDFESGYIYGYRHTDTDARISNYQSNNDWFCPGSMAKMAHQLLEFSHVVKNSDKRDLIRRIVGLTANWIVENVKPTQNGWWPRYCAIDGTWTREDDQFFTTSADGLFILDLLVDLTHAGEIDYRDVLEARCSAFIGSGGLFGSINHDTYDPHECVSYAVAFRTLRRVADVLQNESLRTFAYKVALAGLGRFRLIKDRNDVATKGLLYYGGLMGYVLSLEECGECSSVLRGCAGTRAIQA